METKDLLGQVAEHVRVHGAAGEDPIWERLSRGELGADEDAALRARAAEDPEIALRYEAFRPLGRDVQERLEQQVTTELARPGAPARVRPWRRVAVVVMAPLAAAAALVLVLRRPAAQPDAAPLPLYALALSGGDRATRGDGPRDDEGTIELHRGSQVEIVLRPATAVSVPITVESFLVHGGLATPWPVPTERSSDGAVRIAGETGALFGAVTGPLDLAFVVGPAGLRPVEPAEVASAAAGAGSAHPWQLLERHVRVADGN